MVNQEEISDTKLRQIFTYIQGLKHLEMIRMMFFCSFGMGMRSINFYALTYSDVYDEQGNVKPVIYLSKDKNKGAKSCSYVINSQVAKEFSEYLTYLKHKNKEIKPNTYLFQSQKGVNAPFTRPSISRIFTQIYKVFGLKLSSHYGRHHLITSLLRKGVDVCVVQQAVCHSSPSTTLKYYLQSKERVREAVELMKI